MDILNHDTLKLFMQMAATARAAYALREMTGSSFQSSYLPYCSEIQTLGNIDTADFQSVLSQNHVREQSRQPSAFRGYFRILRSEGQPVQAELYRFGKLRSVQQFHYDGDTRWCFTFLPGQTVPQPVTEAVCFTDEHISMEYRVQGDRLSLRMYDDPINDRLPTQAIQFSPTHAEPLRRHTKGYYRADKNMRYRETFLWLYTDNAPPCVNRLAAHRIGDFLLRLFSCVMILLLLSFPILIFQILFSAVGYWPVVKIFSALLIPLLVVLLTFARRKKRMLKYCAAILAVFIVLSSINTGFVLYDESITIDTAPNINTYEYLPFDENSKIVKLEHPASLQLTQDLPIVDGAAAVFPVYSAFVNAVYPDSTELYDGILEYNNTVGGYKLLSEKQTDIFFGAYPSAEQLQKAEELGTELVFTPIGSDAFVFIVNADNPVDNLTSQQLRMIYSGEITNWKEVGGNDEPISPYQRNEGSGSQSMLIRFMEGTSIMEPETELIDSFMSGIIERVASYRNKDGSIGFSFRYYVEGIIQNPNIKMLSIDGVAPTVENIQNGTYPITTPLYAVTYAGNDNPNVELLLQWVLSGEGQQIIEQTGYVGVGS